MDDSKQAQMHPTHLTRTVVKHAAAAAVHYSGLRRGFAAARRVACGGRRVLILGYHRVVPDFEREAAQSIPGGIISIQTFQRQLESVARAGYEFAPLGQAVEVLTRQRTSKKDLCVLTFDDGYRDVYRHAFPFLRSKGIPATFYLPAGLIGTQRRLDHDRLYHLFGIAKRARLPPKIDELPPETATLMLAAMGQGKAVPAALDDYIGDVPSDALRFAIELLAARLGEAPEPAWGELMNWEEARRISAAGYELGAHTLEHVVLTLEGPTRIDHEIRGSKELIERETGSPVRHFSYCNGWYSEQLVHRVARMGFQSAVTTEDFPNRLGENPFTLKRKVLWEDFSTGLFGQYSPALTSCCVDDVFRMVGLGHPVSGNRTQRFASEAQWRLLDNRSVSGSSLNKTGSLPFAAEGETA
jgi:peptidoglycan/xylan/chitin deacetylase (PgdA/CDA1 family)